jgi:hypothetical protein
MSMGVFPDRRAGTGHIDWYNPTQVPRFADARIWCLPSRILFDRSGRQPGPQQGLAWPVDGSVVVSEG